MTRGEEEGGRKPQARALHAVHRYASTRQKHHKSNKQREQEAKQDRPTGHQGTCITKRGAAGASYFHTHVLGIGKHAKDKRTPHAHPTQQTDNSTEQTQARRDERNKTERRNATKIKRTDKARRSTSKTQDHRWTGKPTNVPLTPGSTTRVLHKAKKGQKDHHINNQTTRASNTRKLSKHNKHNKHTTQKKSSKTPAGERGTSRPTKGGKEIPAAPLLLTSHPPDPRRSREGRACSKRGVGGIPFHSPGTIEPDQRGGRERQTERAPGPIANHPGPRSTMDLDPGVEMQGAGGRKRRAIKRPHAKKPAAINNSLLKTPSYRIPLTKNKHLKTNKATRFLCCGLPSALGSNAK